MSGRVYLGLGSNLGDRERMLRRAIGLMPLAGVRVLRESAVYESEPMYLAAQPRFLNMVLEAETSIAPESLLRRLRGIEDQLGRKRVVANGPRHIDIDVLIYGDLTIETPELKVPHPRMAERRFVLEPLAELAAEWRHPVTGQSVREMLAGLPPGGVARLVSG